MNVARMAINKMTVTMFVAFLLTAGGIIGYITVGKLEDPTFTIKVALVITQYPGATADEVDHQVSEKIEEATEELDQLDYVSSLSRPGLSWVIVNMKESLRSPQMPQVWDDLRKKIRDAQPELPEGAGEPQVVDDFGKVYGVLLALTGDGFSCRELNDYADFIQRELNRLDDVARVDLWGKQDECVYIDIQREKLAALGLPPELIIAQLNQQNQIVPTGNIDVCRERIRAHITGEFQSIEDVRKLVIGGVPNDNLVRLEDVADVYAGYVEPPRTLMRHNGQIAVGIAVAPTPGINVIRMGGAVKDRLDELRQRLPVGLEIDVVAFQPDTVSDAITEFVINLVEAVVIVLVLLLIAMGLRSGLIIGAGLLLTILTTFVVMMAGGIDLQRVSLGALIVSLGMIVDNSIVITENALVKMQQGMSRIDAAARSVADTAWPLLAATIVAILAFMPVAIAKNNTGEFTLSLFLVVAIALGSSWVLAVTIIPAWSYLFLKVGEKQQGKDPYEYWPYQAYKRLLERSLHHRWLVIGLMMVLFAASVYGFQYVKQMFFPQSRRPQLLIDYWLPTGSRIEAVSEDVKLVEKHLSQNQHVTKVDSFIGSGPPRFYLSLDPEPINPNYALVLATIDNEENLTPVHDAALEYMTENFPYAEPRVRRFPLGPAAGFKVEVRFQGPDPTVLQQLAAKAEEIMAENPYSKDIRDDWRQRSKLFSVNYSQPRGRRSSVTRSAAGSAIMRSYQFLSVGVYRKGKDLLPVLVRLPESQRQQVIDLPAVNAWTSDGKGTVPLLEVAPDIKLEWEQPIIRRRDREYCITAQCDPINSITAEDLRRQIADQIESIPLPEGYFMEWGGEYEQSSDSQEDVFKGIPISGFLMLLSVVALFNAFRQPLIVFLVLPLAMIGVTGGLLITQAPFGFLALLGAISLAGMMIKNSVVLIDQADAVIASGTDPYEGVVYASVTRVRPVMLAAFTTVLGVTPLIFDQFWTAMAVTIAFGLTFATLLTLIVVPVLYTLFFRIRPSR